MKLAVDHVTDHHNLHDLLGDAAYVCDEDYFGYVSSSYDQANLSHFFKTCDIYYNNNHHPYLSPNLKDKMLYKVIHLYYIENI